MINNLTAKEQFLIIGEVFLKIGINFWPIIIVAVIAGIWLHRCESHGR